MYMQKPLYDLKTFITTHNSYSGAERGSLRQQLDSGVRGIELDVHVIDAASENFAVGHDYSGSHVSHDNGNPHSDDLQSWLKVINDWSDEHPEHVPISIVFDLKEGFHAEPPERDNDLKALVSVFTAAFPGKTVASTASLTTDALKGKIIGMANNSYFLTHAEIFYLPSYPFLSAVPAKIKGSPTTAEIDDFLSKIFLMNFNGSDAGVSDDITKYQKLKLATRVYKPDLDGPLDFPAEVTFVAVDNPNRHDYQEYHGYQNPPTGSAPSPNPSLEPQFEFRSVVWDANSRKKYGQGREPSIAINESGFLVEVHRDASDDDLFYSIGKLAAGTPPTLTPIGEPVRYDQGVRPMVAILGSDICEVHKAQNGEDNADIWYRVGKMEAGQITWEPKAHKLGVEGRYPAVSMCMKGGKKLVIITLENSEDFNCWRIGELDSVNKAIKWQNLVTTRNKNLTTPEIDMNNGLVAMVWSASGNVYSRIGMLNDKNELEWKIDGHSTYPLFYDTGVRPSVALLENGDVIEIHKASETSSALWSRNAIRSGTVNVWDISANVNAGRESRIAANRGFVAEVHNSQNEPTDLWYMLGTYK